MAHKPKNTRLTTALVEAVVVHIPEGFINISELRSKFKFKPYNGDAICALIVDSSIGQVEHFYFDSAPYADDNRLTRSEHQPSRLESYSQPLFSVGA